MEMAYFKIFRNYGVKNFDDKEKETIHLSLQKHVISYNIRANQFTMSSQFSLNSKSQISFI